MKVVILGAGYAGLRAALDLDTAMGEHGVDGEVTLVDQNPYHQVIQVLHLTATAGAEAQKAIIDLGPLLAGRRVRLVRGRAERIEPLERRVVLADGAALPYDRLAITLGAGTSYSGVPGAAEHSLTLRSFDDALRLREHVIGRFGEAARATDPKQQRILLTTAIVGGGYTGCQLAGELAAWAPQLCQDLGAPRGEVRVALLDRSPQLLKQMGAWAGAAAERALDRRGVSVYLGTTVERVEAQAISVDGGRVLRAGTIVWAGGISGPPLLRAAGLPTDQFGRVLVDRYLRVRDQALIFAAGDCASVPGPQGETVPATASYATRQGEHLAEVLVAELLGRAPRPYDPLPLGELVSLGPDDAVGDPLGVPICGQPALLLKKGVEQYYKSTLR